MGLISYLVNHYEKSNIYIVSATVMAIVFVAIFVVILNGIGLKKIKELEDIS